MAKILRRPWVRATSFILALLLCGAHPAAADLSGSIREYYQEWSGMMATTAPGYYDPTLTLPRSESRCRGAKMA